MFSKLEKAYFSGKVTLLNTVEMQGTRQNGTNVTNKSLPVSYLQSVCLSLKDHQAKWWFPQESKPWLFSTRPPTYKYG